MAQLCPYVIIWGIKYGALGNIVDSIAVIAFIGALLIAGNSGAAINTQAKPISSSAF
jgi:hypothetical protein